MIDLKSGKYQAPSSAPGMRDAKTLFTYLENKYKTIDKVCID